MEIKIQQGEGISQAILRQLQNRDDIADDAVLNAEAWNSIFSEFQTDENSTHKENKIKEEWTELNMNVHTEVDDDIKIDESVWNKIVEIAKNALSAKEGETTAEGEEKASEETAITKDDCRPTNCEGVYYHEGTKTHYIEKDGKLEPMEPKYEGNIITEVKADGSWIERWNKDSGDYRLYIIRKDGIQLKGTDYDKDGKEVRTWTNDENGNLKMLSEPSENGSGRKTLGLYENGILVKDNFASFEVYKDLGNGKYILKVKDEETYVLYEKNDFSYDYICDKDGKKIES